MSLCSHYWHLLQAGDTASWQCNWCYRIVTADPSDIAREEDVTMSDARDSVDTSASTEGGRQ